MSRLESAIRRLEAQRDCLARAVALIRALPEDAPIFELGLGNGRTFDHLREIGGGREIYVFERQIAAHPDCVPDEAHLFLGDVLDTLPRAEARFAGSVALIHADIGTGDEDRNRELAAAIAPFVRRLLMPGGVLASDQDMAAADLAALDLPDGVAPGRYFLYRQGEAGRA